MRHLKTATHLFEVHATHATWSTHSWHATHSWHTAHSWHTTRHATHTVKVIVLDRGGLAVLLILVHPFAEIGLDERGPDLFLGQAGPELRLQLLLADDERKMTARETLLGLL